MGIISIAIHGGAGVIPKDLPDDVQKIYLQGLQEAISVGIKILKAGGTSLDAVTKTVKALEDNPLFNAGVGAVYNSVGAHELDATIMDGSSLKCGAIAACRTIKNPILVARHLMEQASPIFLAGVGADLWAKENNFEMVSNNYFDTEKRFKQLQNAKLSNQVVLDHSKGTVGAVALDTHGNLASATSTGGMTNKAEGRVGDSAVIGAGTYANNETCAISCTGNGEKFIRHVVAHSIHSMMKHKNLSLIDATNFMVNNVLEQDDGGLISVDYMGNIAMPFNSPGMFRASYSTDQEIVVEIW